MHILSLVVYYIPFTANIPTKSADWSLTLKARRPISAPKTQYVSLSMLQETFQHGWHSISEAATEYI